MWVGVDVDLWGFEGVLRGIWAEVVPQALVVDTLLLMAFSAYRHVRLCRITPLVSRSRSLRAQDPSR